jgi:predicted TIM-barrel fold metal-dependent hydrolase
MAAQQRSSIIDTDVHQRLKSDKDLLPYLPRAYQQDILNFGLRLSTTGSGGYLNGGDRGYRADSWPEDGTIAGSELEMMQQQLLDAYNVEYAILTGQDLLPVSTLPDANYGAAVAAAYNDWLIEHWLDKDDRLKGLAYVALQDPRQAAKEIERVAAHPDIVGVIVANGARFLYGQRFYDPVFEACQAHNLPFVLHVGGEGYGSNPSPTVAGYPSYYAEIRQTRAPGYQAHIASMVFEGLFERFPKLQVVFVEGGYIWLPTFLWRLDADWRALHNQTPWVQKAPSEYVFEHCKFTTQPMETGDGPRSLLTVFEWAKAEQTLMFASDYPHWDFDSPEKSLPRLPDELHRRVFSETAREVFQLPAHTAAEVAAD